MDYDCEISDKQNCSKSKSKHFKSKSHLELSKCDHIIFSSKHPKIDEIDEIYSSYLIEKDKKYDFYKVKVIFKLVFDSNNFSKCVTLKVRKNRTRIRFKQFSEKVIWEFKNKGRVFDQIEEMDSITINDERDRTYDFYKKHDMCSLEWTINKFLNEDKTPINNS